VRYLIALLIFLAFLAASQVLKFIIGTYATKFAKKTKTKIDDIVISAVRIPILITFVTGGAYIALRYAEIPSEIGGWVFPLLLLSMGVAIIFGAMRIMSGLVTYLGEKYPGMRPAVPALRNVMNVTVLAVGLMTIMAWLGISIVPILTAFGVAGLAVALALRGTLENFFAGLHIMMERSIQPGDFIKLESGEEGEIVDIGWRTTRVRMLPNNIVVIPNSKLASSTITNYSKPEKEMSCLVQVGVHYDSDLRKVEKVTIEVAKEVLKEIEGGVPEFEPFIRYHTFGDFSINFTVILRVKEFVNKYLVVHEFIKRLHERYAKEGIVIPYPIRTVHLKKK